MSSVVEKLYRVTEEDETAVRKFYGKTEDDIKKDCEVIKKWMKQQKHFPDDYDSKRIERFLLRNKFRIEHTKTKLENYYTTKAANIDYLRGMDPLEEHMKIAYQTATLIPLPNLVNNTDRIYIQRFTGNPDLYSLKSNTLFALALMELELSKEYSVGIHIVMDFNGFSYSHLKTLGVNDLVNTFFLIQECYSARILGIEYINVGPVITTLLKVVKLAVSERLYKKIRIHNDLDSFKSIIPKEYLPSDYGGNLRSISEIEEDTKTYLLENRPFILERLKVIADESKRVGSVRNNELFGVDGSFKKINLD